MLATLRVEAAASGSVYWRNGRFLLEDVNDDVRGESVDPGMRRRGEGRRRDSRDSDRSVDLRFKEDRSWETTSTN